MKKDISKSIHQHRPLFLNLGLVSSLFLMLMAFEWKFSIEADLIDCNFSDLGEINIHDWQILEVPSFLPNSEISNAKIPDNEQVKEYLNSSKTDIQIPEIVSYCKQEYEDLDIEIEPEIKKINHFQEITIKQLDSLTEHHCFDTSLGNLINCFFEDDETICSLTFDSEAEFPEGIEAFYQYVQKNLRYPYSTLGKSISRKVLLQFEVAKNGSIQNIKILQGIVPKLDAEIKRILQNSPKWKPALRRGRPIKTKMSLPIIFKIQ
jgi:periplasmic protein TonB